MKLSGHDSFLEHFDVFSVGVKTAEFLKIIVEFNLFEDFNDKINSADKAFHVSLQSNMRVNAAFSHINF